MKWFFFASIVFAFVLFVVLFLYTEIREYKIYLGTWKEKKRRKRN